MRLRECLFEIVFGYNLISCSFFGFAFKLNTKMHFRNPLELYSKGFYVSPLTNLLYAGACFFFPLVPCSKITRYLKEVKLLV